MPCLNKLDYDGGFWPIKITSVLDEGVLSWVENHLSLITLGPRNDLYDVLENTQINKENAEALSYASKQCWDAIVRKDLQGFGEYFKKSFEAQIKMFPNMIYNDIFKTIERYKDTAYGWKLSGAGGGGYLVFVTEHTLR